MLYEINCIKLAIKNIIISLLKTIGTFFIINFKNPLFVLMPLIAMISM